MATAGSSAEAIKPLVQEGVIKSESDANETDTFGTLMHVQ
jgi:hypothetical protein